MICVSIGKPEPHACLEILAHVEMAEIRLDGYDLNGPQIRQIFSMPVDLIATCRPGGPGSGQNDDERKRKLMTAIEAGAAYVDIEIEAGESFKKELMDFAREKECLIIISYHNYEMTPSIERLEHIVGHCLAIGADVAKVACKAVTEADSARLLSLYDSGDRSQILALGMGEKGTVTRVAAPFLGAPFTYASLAQGMETAPGQLDKTALESIYSSMGNREE